jgi:hypothetical protein
MHAPIHIKFAVALYLMKPGNYKRLSEAWTTGFKINGVEKRFFLHHHNQTGSGSPINVKYWGVYRQGETRSKS